MLLVSNVVDERLTTAHRANWRASTCGSRPFTRCDSIRRARSCSTVLSIALSTWDGLTSKHR